MKKYLVVIILAILVWGCSHKTVPAKTETAATLTTGNVAAGEETFTAKCGRCHELKNPGDFTANKWVDIIAKMAPKAKLDPTETQNVLAYVQANAKQ